MATQVLPKPRTLIPSGFVVRALSRRGRRFHCGNCGDVMFVRYASGLCPMCFNDRKPWQATDEPREVPAHLALAGILDDPSIEQDWAEGGAIMPAPGAIDVPRIPSTPE